MKSVEIGPEVKEIIDGYLKDGEKYVTLEIYTCYQNEKYIYSSFHKNGEITGYLLIKSDGTVPQLDSSLERVLEIASQTVIKFRNMRTIGKQFARMGNERLMRRTFNLLKRIESTQGNKMTQDRIYDLRKFIESAEVTIEKQLELRKFVNDGLRLMDEITKRGEVTEQDYENLTKFVLGVSDRAFEQTSIQMETYYNRKRLIRYLFKKKNYLSAFRLFITHLRLHPEKPKNEEDYEAAREAYEKKGHDKNYEEILKRIYSKTRNPIENG
ncbi:hypothetical protein C8P63_12077 [Melghirimyces profundicolus]|uniref:Uncharacterized protein n=1 Tax=Melghirimyces profundicolus TaxID=1242148 RepID=A0A2T6BGV2_9BACL|nr:hypothetical protein [Melghirimyces profundicolus]PTX55280.1 hypothetical protein C8P63_12077 [Melghirimyces profundicolus]